MSPGWRRSIAPGAVLTCTTALASPAELEIPVFALLDAGVRVQLVG